MRKKREILWLVAFTFALAAERAPAEEETFQPLSEEQLVRHYEGMCGFRLATWFGEHPPQEMDLRGKKPVLHPMPPIFSKEFDREYYELQGKVKAAQSAKTYAAAKKKEAEALKKLEALLNGTDFYKTCRKIAKKVAAECLKNQESLDDLKKCSLFYQGKFDALDRHNNHIKDLPELRKKADAAAKWLEE